jgi:hypothetical protein
MLAAAGTIGPATPARAAHGESTGTKGVYRASCDPLRTIAGNVPADVILACDADRRSCELFRTTTTQGTFNEGLPVGFCADSFPTVRPIQFPTAPPADFALETDVKVRATSFGVDSGAVAATDPLGVSDVVCSTFAGPGGTGVRACRRVVRGNCPPSGCPSCDGFMVTRSSDCAELRSQLGQSVTADRFVNLSHALLLDVDRAAQAGSEALLVCTGFKWECVNPATVQATGVKAQYQFPFGVVQTPVCVTFNRQTICK